MPFTTSGIKVAIKMAIFCLLFFKDFCNKFSPNDLAKMIHKESIILLLVYFSVDTCSHSLQILDSGVMKILKDDMVVIFFMTIKNHEGSPRRAMIRVVECCERIHEAETDCDIMNLYGGDYGVIEPGTIRNLTLIYPNLYGYNRKGTCLVTVLHRCLAGSVTDEIRHRIDFDTTISTEKVPIALEGWYDPGTFVTCDSPDLDPFDHCNPVNCQLKYSGYRNYFNREWKMCQKVPMCKANEDKDLPDVVYIPNSNTCRNLENFATAENIKSLIKKSAQIQNNKPSIVNVRCHHGEINPKTGFCVCDYGWKSEVFDVESYNSQSIYTMCNIQCPPNDRNQFLIAFLGIVLAFWFIFCVICCEIFNCVIRTSKKHFQSYSPRNTFYPSCQQQMCYSVASILPSTKTSLRDLN